MKRKRYTLKEKQNIILDYIKRNPQATHRSIKEDTKLHVNRIFRSLKEAFKLAGIKVPRTFDFKNRNQRRKIIINYIKRNPTVGGHTIAKETKINPCNAFKSIKEAFEKAGVQYPRKIDQRKKEEKKREILKLVKENPLITIPEIIKKVRTQPYKLFKNLDEIYEKAKIKPFRKGEKRKIKKQQEIIRYIKENPLATQREINNTCKTHVQEVFDKGIFDAYKKAGIKFPFERLKAYGIGIKEIRERAKTFEEEIAINLSGYGKVNRLVKTKRGFADIIFERKNKRVIIEVKDYKNKEISISQINQLNKYLEDCLCNLGFLICHKKPKKDKFLINKNSIFVLEKEELNRVPKLIDGIVG